MSTPEGVLLSKVVGSVRISIVPLTFDRARLIIGPAADLDSYDDDW
jgi:hypothetical protein